MKAYRLITTKGIHLTDMLPQIGRIGPWPVVVCFVGNKKWVWPCYDVGMTQPNEKLRTNPIWKNAFALAEYMYDDLEKESSNFPEYEEWNTKSKIRNSSNDMIFYVAQALGSRAPGGNEYEWNNAKKYVSGLLTAYLFAGKRQYIHLEPDTVVKIESMISAIDSEIVASREAAKKRDQDELEPWLAKLKVFEKINGGNSTLSK